MGAGCARAWLREVIVFSSNWGGLVFFFARIGVWGRSRCLAFLGWGSTSGRCVRVDLLFRVFVLFLVLFVCVSDF